MTRSEAIRFRNHLNTIIESLDDEAAIDVFDLFPMWVNGKTYAVDDRVRYNDILYKCIIAHTSQADWTPDVAVSLWVRVDDPTIEWPEWIQPVGAQDAYAAGAKVSHNDKHWISDVDNNVWEPGVYGWTEAIEEVEGE